MSFKTRIIDYCDSKKVDCNNCPFRKPCDMVDDNTIPKYFTDRKMKQFEKSVDSYRKRLFGELKEIADLMSKAVMDDALEYLDTILKGGKDGEQ